MWILLLLMAAMLVCGCRPEGKRSGVELPVYTVEVTHPVRGNVSLSREWVGRLEGMVSAGIIPQVSGYVSERLFTNGQMVQAGQILYRLDATRYRQALEQALQRQSEAQANAEEARQTVAYYKPLVSNGSISRQSYTDAVQRELAASSALAAARAGVELARTNVDYCTLSSPVEGIVGFARADVGSYVAPGGEPMVLVNSVNPIRVCFSISEQDWLNQGGAGGALRPGAHVQILLSNGQLYPEPATIVGVDNTVNTSTGTLMLDAHLANPHALLRPGMYVRVRAQVEEEKDVLLVPEDAVVSIQGKTMLVEVDAQGQKASLVPVTTGLSQKGQVAVSGPISTDSLIVCVGTQQGMMAAEKRATLRVQQKAMSADMKPAATQPTSGGMKPVPATTRPTSGNMNPAPSATWSTPPDSAPASQQVS